MQPWELDMGGLNKVLAPEQYKKLLNTRESDHLSLLAACHFTQHEQDMLAEDAKVDHKRLCEAVLSLNVRDASVKGAIAFPAKPKHESSEPRLKKRKADTSTLVFPSKNIKGKRNNSPPGGDLNFLPANNFPADPLICKRSCNYFATEDASPWAKTWQVTILSSFPYRRHNLLSCDNCILADSAVSSFLCLQFSCHVVYGVKQVTELACTLTVLKLSHECDKPDSQVLWLYTDSWHGIKNHQSLGQIFGLDLEIQHVLLKTQKVTMANKSEKVLAVHLPKKYSVEEISSFNTDIASKQRRVEFR